VDKKCPEGHIGILFFMVITLLYGNPVIWDPHVMPAHPMMLTIPGFLISTNLPCRKDRFMCFGGIIDFESRGI
jgi:hypothetical protein